MHEVSSACPPLPPARFYWAEWELPRTLKELLSAHTDIYFFSSFLLTRL